RGIAGFADIASAASTGMPRTVAIPIARHRDLLAFVGIVVALLLLTTLPYLYGYRSAPSNKQFMGILLNVPDTAQYLSWARELSRSLLSENKLTPEPDNPVFFNLFWLAVGRTATVAGFGYAEALQLLRPLAGLLYLGAIHWFVGLVVPER